MATMNSNGAAVHGGIVTTLNAIGDVSIARPAAFIERRLEEATAALSVRQRFEATALLLNAALSRFTVLVWEPLADGTPAGIDPISGFVRVKAPWASHSYKAFGLRRGEQATMHRYMHHWSNTRRGAPALFLFDGAALRWAANLAQYPDLAAALAVQQRAVFTAELVAKLEQANRAADARRRRK